MPNVRQPSSAGWRCPQCGRRFRQRTREHSCDVRSLASHLDRASPPVKELATVVLDTLADIGPHAVVPVKTMIVVRAASNFAGLVMRRNSVDVAFFLPRMLNSTRIHKIEKVGPSKYAHHTRLTSIGDVDAQLIKWLREAYEVGARNP